MGFYASPGGATELSPALQRWERWGEMIQVPEGRPSSHAKSSGLGIAVRFFAQPVRTSLPRVIPSPVVRLIRTARGRVRQVHPQLPEFRIGIAFGGIVRQQILRPQFVANLLKRAVQLRQGSGVEILSARVARDLHQRVLAARVPARVGFNRNYNDAVD